MTHIASTPRHGVDIRASGRARSSALAWPDTLRGVGVAALAAFATLPIFDWLPGEMFDRVVKTSTGSYDWYANAADAWLSGSAIAVGVGLVVAILSRRMPGLYRDGLLEPIARQSERPVRAAGAVALAALLLYVIVARVVFGGRPLIVDEVMFIEQAQTFAAGRLWTPTARHVEFFNTLLMADHQGRHFSQMLPGSALLLTLGVWARAPWLVNPVCGAITVLAFADLLRHGGVERRVALGATILFAAAPFTFFMSGSYMNHVPAQMWIMLGAAGTARLAAGSRRPALLAAGIGFAFGMAAIVRSVEALAFAVPAAVWLLAGLVRRRQSWVIVPAGLAGAAVPLAFMAWVNVHTTGAPFLLGYVVLWGKEHGLGFQERTPWGPVHTPLRGVAITNLYLVRLQTALFEAPIPSLLPGLAAFALTKRLSSADRYLLATAAALVGCYFAYWFDGYWLGPRFYYPLVGIAALWTARFPGAMRRALGDGTAYRTAMAASFASVVIAVTSQIPVRWSGYAESMPSTRWDAERGEADAGVRGALVFVRESWGAQLFSRMWALDVPRGPSERLYASIDACMLDETLRGFEERGVRGAPVVAQLERLALDSASLTGSPYSPDYSERFRPGQPYTRRCAERVKEDVGGFTSLAPKQLARRGGNVYARDLHEKNLLLLAEYPNRPLYLLHPRGSAPGTPPEYFPLDRDSVVRAWSTQLADATPAAPSHP